MDWWLLTFFLGAILSLFLPEVPAISQLFLLLCLTIGFFLHKKLRLSSGLLLGSLWLLIQAYLYQSQLPNTLVDLMHNKQVFVVEGDVLSIQSKSVVNATKDPQNKSQNTLVKENNVINRFNFRVSKVNQQELDSPIIVRLSWKKATVAVAQGYKLSLNVKLKPAHGLLNIGSFNYLSWLRANNISATGYVVNPKKGQKNKVYVNQLVKQNSSVRQQLFNKYLRIAPEHELKPILMALAFGERSGLNASHWEILQATGTSHLIAISGLHIGLLASGVYLLMMLCIRYLPLTNPSWQSVNIRYFAIVASLLFAVVYAYLAGFSLPTQRALVMLLLYWSARIFGVRFSAKRLLLITVFILLVFSPFSLFTVSFWLSFYAVVIIFLSLWRFQFWLSKGSAPWRFVKGLLVIQCALTVMLIPIGALFFQKISLISLAANIFAVPWMSAISIPCSLLSVILMPFSESVAQWFIALALQSLSVLWYYLTLLSELPYASIALSWQQQKALLGTGFFLFLMIYLSPLPYMKIAAKIAAITLVFVFVSVFASSSWTFSDDNAADKNTHKRQLSDNFTPWQVVFFDVGQGLSVLIKRNGHGVLYDTGAAYPSGFNMSEAVVLPYLQHIGMTKLDKVILSHSDNDHAGGITLLENKITIEELISNDSEISQRPLSACIKGQRFNWQGLTFEVLSPSKISLQLKNSTALNRAKDAKESSFSKQNVTKQKNDDSCVMLISDRTGKTVLLTGDISKKIETQIQTSYPKLSVDILQVPHHGSKTSSSREFVKQLSPQLAVVSAGYLNRWRMPTVSVKQRYLDESIQLLNTAEVGQVVITLKQQDITVQSYIDDLRPFWFSH